MDASRGDNFSEVSFAVLVPPQVPKTRGPSLAAGRRTPGGPPRTTPTRAVRRCYLRSGRSLAGAPPCPEQARARRLIPQAADGESIAWSRESVAAESAPSLRLDVVSESPAALDAQSGIVSETEPGKSPGGRHRRASPSTGPEADLQRMLEATAETPLPGLYVPRVSPRPAAPLATAKTTTPTPSSRYHTPTSMRFEVLDNANLHGEDDEAESLPTALPPPKPHPVGRSTPALQPAVKATKLRLGGDAAKDAPVSPRGGNTASGAGKTDDDGAVRGGEKRPAAPRRNVATSAPPGRTALAPAPVPLQSAATSLLTEVGAWMEVLNSVEDANCYRLYLGSSERALQGTQREMAALQRMQLAVDAELQAAKARQLESRDGSHARQSPAAQVGDVSTKGSDAAGGRHTEEAWLADAEEDAEIAGEEEAWRIEKGELLAEKALLLQKRKELCYHLRRGTNIKNVAALSLSEGNARSKADGWAADASHAEAASHANGLEIIQLRLELKEAQVQFLKLVDSHRIMQDSQRTRAKEFADEFVRLRLAAAAARQEAEGHRGALEATLRRSEELRGRCRQKDEASLLLLLEQRVEEARAALRSREDKLARSDSLRSRRSSVGRAPSAGLTARRLSGPAGALTAAALPERRTSAGPTPPQRGRAMN
ncbi:uncharacterized protein Tco025E_07389 [Trypanosoma conorhini]|uniref:Uncharacterized protein n=1 Tax=Trypanosoma conorhini TaxID=83891 RepID=A0A3R7MSC6_9TRYP|nr:uncharacterized protein Tco025E_07389 [Trypanosoma conorhini]RNF07338.1 hypothetical protein Tco025E_07389 [Trypanosoma conorhini]